MQASGTSTSFVFFLVPAGLVLIVGTSASAAAAPPSGLPACFRAARSRQSGRSQLINRSGSLVSCSSSGLEAWNCFDHRAHQEPLHVDAATTIDNC